ncbi:MAG: hypothetical protein KIS85_06270 [Anaerolineales bacterium]|nr:hypothetical protein [Anaerolineales bacterium]
MISAKTPRDKAPAFLDDVRLELALAGERLWENVMPDVLGGVSAEWGINGTGPGARIADIGSLKTELNNSEANSAGRLGFYSPENEGGRPGFRKGAGMRLVLCYQGKEYIKGRGWISAIAPAAGKYGPRRTSVTAEDAMARLAEYDRMAQLPLQKGKRPEEVLHLVLDQVQPKVDRRRLDRSAPGEELNFVFDQATGSYPTALSEISRVMRSTRGGYFYVRGDGTLRFETRHTRFKPAPFVGQVVVTARELQANDSNEDRVDRVRVTTHPEKVAGTRETIFALNNPIRLRSGEEQTFTAPYSDPSNGRLSGADDVITTEELEPGEHYTFGSGHGDESNNLAAQLEIELQNGATVSLVRVRNTGTSAGSLNTLRLEGKPIRRYEPVVKEESAAQPRGNRSFAADLDYVSDAYKGAAMARAYRNRYQDPPAQVRVSFVANRDHESMRAALLGDVGGKVYVEEKVSGVGRAYFINRCSLELFGNLFLAVTWVLEPAYGRYLIWGRGRWGRQAWGW